MVSRFRWIIALLAFTAVAHGQLPPTPGEGERVVTQSPQLFVANRTIELGDIVEGDRTPLTWRLENHGNADLIIDRVRSGCGCAVVQLAEGEKVIPPGGVVELKGEFNSRGRRGPQKKGVRVYSNDPEEPSMELSLKATVQVLYNITPASLLNLRGVRRGEAASKTLDIFPGPDRQSVSIKAVEIPDELPLSQVTEELEARGARGKRIRFTVSESASLGLLAGQVKILLSVDGIERERPVSIRADVMGALSWSPRILDATRQVLVPQRRLAPVTIRSTERMPFRILGASVGAPLGVTFRSKTGKDKSSDFTLHLTVRDDASPGPFATTLEVRTSSLDQPWISIAVFGIIDSPVKIEPPLVLLRADGTPVGTRRRVKLTSGPSIELELASASCDNSAVRVEIERPDGRNRRHQAFLAVELVDDLPKGTHEAIIRVVTGIEGHEIIEIPVTIDATRVD